MYIIRLKFSEDTYALFRQIVFSSKEDASNYFDEQVRTEETYLNRGDVLFERIELYSSDK